MKDCYRTPIIINLGKCINERKNVARTVRKRFESIKSSKKKCMHLGQSIKKNSNIYMMSECDEVLKNDFKWLINFNLKEIPIYDIDEKVLGSKAFKRQRSHPKKPKKKNVIKHTHNYSLSDVIQQCLFIKDQATIKEINKWISAAFPCFKSNDCTWKNSVRKTLSDNPIFKKKKLKLGKGKSDLWCLDENYLRDSPDDRGHIHKPAKGSVGKNDSTKIKTSNDFKEVTSSIDTMQDNILSDENVLNSPNVDGISGNSSQMNLSPIWFESTELQESHFTEVKDEDLIGCYKMPAEFQDENVEPVEIHFLDENNMPILIDLI